MWEPKEMEEPKEVLGQPLVVSTLTLCGELRQNPRSKQYWPLAKTRVWQQICDKVQVFLISSYTYSLFFMHHCMQCFSWKILVQFEGKANEEYWLWLTLQGYATREKGTSSSLLFLQILPVVDNAKVPLGALCTCIIQDMHFFVITFTWRKQGLVRCTM